MFKITNLKNVISLAGLFMLTACSGDINTDLFSGDAPVVSCPRVAVLPNADRMTIFREGPGRDLTDVTFEGVIKPVKGECEYDGDYQSVEVDLILRIGAIKGPAADSQQQNFKFFVAIADKTKKILNKKIFDSSVSIAEGQRRGIAEEELSQVIPIPSGRFGPEYTIIVGFQLSESQLKYNQKATR
jgi:hypothetical protein